MGIKICFYDNNLMSYPCYGPYTIMRTADFKLKATINATWKS